MFDFTFHNLPGFLIAFIPALINFVLVIYILYLLPRNRLTNLFGLLTLSLSLWQMDDSLGRIAATAATADLWDCILSAAWILVGSLCLHFAMLYSGIMKPANSRLYSILLYTPGFIFMGLYQAHYYSHNFQYLPFWGWVNSHNENLLDSIQVYWIAILVICATIILFFHSSKIKIDKLHKSQAYLITAGIAIPTFSGVITQAIYPIALGRDAIPVTSTFMTFFSVATVVALKKYKLFSISDLISNETLIEAMPVMVFSVSKEKRITYMNDFGLELMGLKKANITNLNIDEMFGYGTEYQKNFETLWHSTFKQEKIENIELSLPTPQGEIDLSLTSSPIINNNKVEGVLFTARDITEVKKSHKLIKTKQEQLEEAQQLSHLGSWDWEIESNIVTWSDELYRIYGYTPGEIPIAYETFLQHVHPDERETVNHIIQKAYTDYQPFQFYHRITRKDGIDVTIYAQGNVTVDENNHAVRMNGTGQDVTELKTKEDILEAQNEELKKINSELDKFVYSVSHDLRAPLTSLLGIVEISSEEIQEPVLKERFELLKLNIRKLDNFILDILDYSKNSRQEIVKEEIDFKAKAEEVIQNLKFMISGDRKIDIRINVNGNGSFRSDKNRIGIILNNLISNALRYADPAKDDPFVEISFNVSDGEAAITVKDNGIGIDKKLHGKIFEMFYRGSENSIGSGLGLYIAKESVKKLNGQMELESCEGEGSLFRVHIPNNEIQNSYE